MNNYLQEFRQGIKEKSLKIAVVGLGYVGLPLAVEFAKKGFSVLGIDLDKDRVERVNSQESYIVDVGASELRGVVKKGTLKAESNFVSLQDRDVIFVCVPTPLKRKYHPDISFIKEAIAILSKNLREKALVILESTTYPGTTEEVILPMLESAGLKHGLDFYLCFSPERIDPGNLRFSLKRIPKVVGGLNDEATTLATMIYRTIIGKVIPVSSCRVAETVKLLENTFRIVNIGLIDELAMMAHKMKIDIWEVIEAARTKPFGFMPFYPGPGVGGHCLDKNETLYVKGADSLKIMRMGDFIKHIQKAKDNDIEVLSFDPLKRRSVFKKVTAASARPYSGQMVNILTEDGRYLKVTDLHPMFVYNDDRWQLRYAKDLEKGDRLPLCLELPEFSHQPVSSKAEIDIIDNIQQHGRYLIDKARVKPLDFSWRDYGAEVKSVLRRNNANKIPDSCWDYLSDNTLPLKYFYTLEKLVKIAHHRLKLVTGRGPSYNEIPAVINLDEDFCRLLGYYLSEGCYTKDKSARTRFSFNRSEKEYIHDVVSILSPLGIRSSVYESKTWHTSCIKVSSNLFGFLIYEVLGCGKDCYTMKMPEQIFSLDTERKKALLAGVFRGDACVEHFFGRWRYRKNEKEYLYNVNTAHISFFTSSQKLFQQLIVLLHDLGIIPTFKKRRYSLSIFGYEQLEFFKDIFDGKKKEIILRYLELNKNRPKNKTFNRFSSFATVKVKSVSMTKGDWVYSVETVKPHAFVTSYGIVVHNCIPKDPLYLYWKAKKFGFKSRFIKLSSEVISSMPAYVAERVIQILHHHGIALKKAKILVLGVTYKKDIKDLRKSPSLDIIEIFSSHGAAVSYHDPLIPYLKINSIDLKSIKLTSANIKRYHCVIIATDHSSVNYKLLLDNAQLIFDARNVYRGISHHKIIKL